MTKRESKSKSVGSITLSNALEARRIGTGVAPSTRWPTEIWTIHEANDPGASVNQFTLYRHKGKWHPWTGSIIREKDRNLACKLSDLRNSM
jgi:hypothetical protein